MRRGARDRRQKVDAVEVEPGGRPDSFDGNHQSGIVSWLIVDTKALADINVGDLDRLMDWTAKGHLAWVVVPARLES